MKYIYHVSQTENKDYDTYSDFVVCAETEEDALNTHPHKDVLSWTTPSPYGPGTWASSTKFVKVKLIGKASEDIELGIICASFHAG